MRRALIVGTARCVWDDLEAFDRLRISGVAVIAINFMGTVWPVTKRLEHWVSLHTDPWMWRYWLQARANGTGDVAAETIAPGHVDGISRVIPAYRDEQLGTSGLYAASIAFRELGYEQGWLVGVPMDGSGHFYDPPGLHSRYDGEHYAALWKATNEWCFQGRLRSMSGRTREWLGGPE